MTLVVKGPMKEPETTVEQLNWQKSENGQTI